MKILKNAYLQTLICSSTLLLGGCDKLKDLPVGKGFTAKYLCSFVFNSGLDEEYVKEVFIEPKVDPLPLIWKIDVNYDQKIVTVGDLIFGSYGSGKAVHREGIGCTLLVDKNIADLDSQSIEPIEPPQLSTSQTWPYGGGGLYAAPIPGLDVDQLNDAVASAFVESADGPRNTTAIVVAYDGKLIAEQYAHGLTHHTPMLGWSMTKTISGTLIGILQDQDKLDVDDAAPIPGWAGTNKAEITIRDIVHMASGLDFNEDYGGLSDVSKMLYLQSDQVAYTAGRPLIAEPGAEFNYTTGQSNLLAKIVQDTVGGSMQDAYDFYQQQLFHKVDIASAFIEFDAAGHFVGGAYCFMTPRDWARMGQLYLNRGQWNGVQVVSEDWIDYVTMPAVVDYYGGQLWLNTNGNEWPGLPHDTYYFAGHQGQRILVIPSKSLVVVRMGITENYNLIKEEEFVGGIIQALP